MVERQPDPSLDPGRAPTTARQRASQAPVFDQLVQRYETAYRDRPEQVRAGMWLAERLDSGARVLDVGCGTGVPTARQLVDAGIQVVGIDISPAMVSAASAAVPEAIIHNCDVLDLTESGFDGAVAFFSLLMLPRTDILRALSVLHKAIQPGGYLLISMVEADLDDTPVKFLDTDVRVSGYQRDALCRVVEQAGFAILDMRVVDNTPAIAQAEPETQLYVYSRCSPYDGDSQ
ncbi:class I SAM-dependent methyltransferase [Nocardia uniformis]|nr:class I SAM-dependent methyltransferase [Nocardia uniformis]